MTLVLVLAAIVLAIAVSGYSPTSPIPSLNDNSIYFGSFGGFNSLVNQQGNVNDHAINLGALKWNGSAWDDLGMLIDTGQVYATAVNPSNGHMFFGGTFASIRSVTVNHVVEFDGQNYFSLGEGLSGGYVNCLLHNGTALFVGGSFSNAANPSYYTYNSIHGVAMWINNKWQPLMGGLNGIVNTMMFSPLTNTSIILGGSFFATADSKSDYIDQSVSLTATASALATATGNFNASFVLNNPSRLDGPGNIWLAPPNTVSTLIIDLGYATGSQIARIRVANTHYQNGGSFGIFFTYATTSPYTLPSANYLSLYYFNPLNLQWTTCSSNLASVCYLPRDPTLPYVDFYVVNVVDMRALAITISSTYGNYAGLSSVQLFRRDALFNAMNIRPTLTGTWTTLPPASSTLPPSFSTTISTGASTTTSMSVTSTLSTYGNYQVLLQTTATANPVTQVQVQLQFGNSVINTTTVTFTTGSSVSLLYQGVVFPVGVPITITFTPIATATNQVFAFWDVTVTKAATLTNLLNLVVYDLTGLNFPTTPAQWVYTNPVSTVARESLSNTNVVVGGSFSGPLVSNPTVLLYGLAQLNPQTGAINVYANRGMNGNVYAVAPTLDGTGFVVGGSFLATNDNTIALKNVAIYNLTTSSWQQMGSGVSNSVLALGVTSTSVFVGGTFTFAYQAADSIGIFANGLVRFNLTDGNFYGISDSSSATIRAIFVNSTDDSSVYYGGLLSSSQNVGVATTSNCIVQKQGSSWKPINGSFDVALNYFSNIGAPIIYAAAYFNNTIFVGGYFSTQNVFENEVKNLAMLNGSNWISVGRGVAGTVSSLLTVNNVLWIGGSFTESADPATFGNAVPLLALAAWNGTTLYSPAPVLTNGVGGTPSIKAMALVNGNTVIIGGSFQSAGSVLVRNIAAWDGNNWNALGAGVDSLVTCLLVFQNTIVVGGTFAYAGNIIANNIALYDMNIGRWRSLSGTYGTGVNGAVTALAIDQDLNSLFIAGSFNVQGYRSIAKYDSVLGFVSVGNLTNGNSHVTALRVANAANTHSNNWLSSGRVLVAYGYIILPSTYTFGYGSVIFDGYNWYPESVVTNAFTTFELGQPTAVIYGFLEIPPSSGLQAWQIAVAVIFSILGAVLIGGAIALVVLRMRKSGKL